MISFLKSNLVAKLVSDQAAISIKKQQASYNLFTISSYNSYIENFHSDIIASLLNPSAAHHQGDDFLLLFIDFLNKFHELNIKKADYKFVEVSREKGRLDIWLKDTVSKRCIIIENKINNAVDMDQQIDRYYEYAVAQKFKVDAIIYLTLDGTKKAPPANAPIKQLIKNVAAFTNQSFDLTNGWLEPCLDAANNPDSSSFIYQYIKLLKHLANRSMETNTMEELYNFISAENGFQTLETIIKMYANLTTFRADQFSKAIAGYSPFQKQFRYRPWYVIYDYYLYKDHQLKLDVWFEDNGGAEIVFWNVTTGGINGRMVLTERLNAIGLLQEFTDEVSYHDNGYSRHFVIGDQYHTMAEIDKAVLEFVLSLMKKLNAH